jgi:ADP-heptose:LPS heptosyltransferase
LDCRGCEFWNLQGGSDRQRWSDLTPGLHLHNADNCEHSVLSLAATIAQLDLIVTSDTLAAHLAGALGIPAWVMLERAADWRWQHARKDSPWYPSLRLFRQHRDGDWASVIARVGNELHAQSLKRRMVA